MLERVGSNTVQERMLFVLDAKSVDALSALASLPCKHFTCLVAWDASSSDIATISQLAKVLLDSGAAYIATWGSACELVHDVVDETLVEREVMQGIQQPLVMTTWHSHESLAHALWFLTFAAAPDDEYLETCEATVAISIGSGLYAAEMRSAFRDPEAFNTQVLAEPPGAA